MNKTIMKILISTLILLIGIGAVSAIEQNSTDEFMSVEQTDEISAINDNTSVISINENNNEILNAESNTTTISASENNNEILNTEDNTSTISASENNNEILNAESNTTVISLSNDDLTTYSPFAQEPQGTQSQTEFKTFYVGKVTFLKKYKNMLLNGYKIPSKKNKKAWKKHVAFKKAYNKQLKLLKKSAIKRGTKSASNHWHSRGDAYYKIKYTRKCIQLLFYIDCYRTYNYNALLKKGWWD